MLNRALLAFAATLLFVWPVSPASAQSVSDQLFMQRLAGGSVGNPPEVILGSLPPGWTSPVPLPSDTPILGSVRSTSATGSVTVYYNPADAQAAFDAYTATLRAAGFTMPSSPGPQGGFVASSPRPAFAFYCHGAQAITIMLPPNSAHDLRVSIPMPGNGFGLCTRPTMATLLAGANRQSTPLPAFTAPAGTTLVGTGTSFGTSANVATLSSTAAITGNLDAGAIVRSLTGQLQRAGWHITDSAIGHDSAVAAIEIAEGSARWRGSLVVYRAPEPKTYAASVQITGSGSLPAQSMPATIALPNISAKTLKSSEPAVLELLKRLVVVNYAGGADAVVYVGKAPPAVDKGLLPDAKPVGSTGVRPRGSMPLAYSIYYDLSNSQLQRYVARLKAAGWKTQTLPQGAMGGFNNTTLGGIGLFCKNGAPSVALVAAPGESNEVMVEVGPQNLGPCPAIPDLPSIQTGFSQLSPLPQLTAPPGATMRSGTPGIMGSPTASGASIETSLSLPALLDAFTAQLTRAGWTAAPSSATASLGSRSFTITDSKMQKWQAVMTIYRSATEPGRYYSYIDLTNVTLPAQPPHM